MNNSSKLLNILLPLVVVGLLLCLKLPHTVDTTRVGVRIKKLTLFGKKSVEKKAYGPGVYFFLPFFNDWYTFDTTLKTLQMTIKSGNSDVSSKDDLIFKTIDGNDISLDMILTYRIDPKKAPYILQRVASSDREIKNTLVRLFARSKPRDIFGELTTEDFYKSLKRAQKAKEVEKTLNKFLNPYGVIVEAVKTKDYRFNVAYAKAIKDRKVADQKTQRYISETRASEEGYKKKLEDANGAVSEMRAKVDGEYRQEVLLADAYYKSKEMEAKAIKVEGEARSRGIAKMNQALSGAGGVAQVKLEIAKSLQGKKIVLLPSSPLDIRSTNVNQLIDILGITSLSKDTKTSTDI